MGSEQTAANQVLFAAHNYDNKKQLSPGASNSTPDIQGRLGSYVLNGLFIIRTH